MAVPYTFANATSAIPLSQLDSNFATAVTIGNVAIQLGNTATTLSNLNLGNVTITSSSISNVSVGGTANAVVYANTTNILSTNANLKFDGTNVQVANSLTSANTFGFKNRIINGGMVIDQRNAGASVTFNSGDEKFLTDRFSTYQNTGTGVFTGQQSSTAPTGFTNSLKFTTTTANASLSASQRWQFLQQIEGFNTADLGFGTANAKTVTLSFWVYSSLTGTFAGSLNNSAIDRSYVFNYTISLANTWEQKTITITGDTSGTWLTTNGTGIRVYFSLGAGTNYNTTAGTWASGFYTSTSGATSVIGTLNATWYVTGVQLEVGTQATSFDFRDYGSELLLCQRYYEKMYEPCGMGRCNNTPAARFFARFTVLKRTTPTITGTGSFAVSDLYTTDAIQTANQGISGSTAISASGFSFSILCSTLDSPTPFVTGALAANITNTGVLTGSAEL